MTLEREKFFSAVAATAIATAAAGCGGDRAPNPVQPEPQSTAVPDSVAQAKPQPEPAKPAVEPKSTPEVEQVGPTRE